MDVRDVLSFASPSPQLKRSLKPPPPPSLQLEADAKRPKVSADHISAFSDTSSDVGDLEDFSRPFNAPDSWDSETNNGPTTVGANEVTETTVRRLTVLLEKRALSNQEARTKFPDQPKRFMQSELELQETLEEMQVLAANPELYPILAEQTRPISLLLGLLAHENTDISLSVIDLLHELLESSCLQEAGLDKVNQFLEVLFSGQLIQSLIQNISRLDETKKDEADGIVESLLEIRPDMNVTMANQGLFAWLLRRLQKRPVFDKNKLYVSELLSILLQMDEANRRQLGEVDGIDILLQQLSVYKRHDPGSQEEIELMLNLFDCLCSSLMLPENKDRFLKGEGIQLMNLMLREKHMSRDSALRVLDYTLCPVSQLMDQNTNELQSHQKSTINTVDPEAVVIANCSKFIEILGLRTIFPLFMHCPREHALRSTSIISALLRHSPPETFKSRVLAKFVENDHEKVDRLIELHLKYLDIVKATNSKVEAMRRNEKKWIGYTREEVETELMLKRLEGGLLPLQVLDVIILDVCVNGAPTILERVLHLLKMRSISINSVLDTVQGYVNSLGEESTTGTSLSEKTRVMNLLKKFKELLTS
ncbi:beta-catenin-like protein 1 [Schistosoma bovis]|uniref:Beta-catenin-like protein 1 n=1 Tax=Schistosoma bovis TaxID=6184 RepID=A0A430QH04_SCHBO|nr:beta-catenin-like protein 1 [Schistosoma bovis]